MNDNRELLNQLRADFGANDVGKLPKPTKKQTAAARDQSQRHLCIWCDLCGGWHHKDVVHLDYVGHAAITKRLLDVDPGWHWEPMGKNQDGTPVIDQNNGLWITLHVAGMKRIGYGEAGRKTGGDAIKEAIGDAIRNAGMRFGMALELWHKGEFDKDMARTNAEEELKRQEEEERKLEAHNAISDWVDNCLTQANEKATTTEARGKYLAAVIPKLQEKCAKYQVVVGPHMRRIEEAIEQTKQGQ